MDFPADFCFSFEVIVHETNEKQKPAEKAENTEN